jgi:hypothetical protein
MLDEILQRMRAKITAQLYVMTMHAEVEMEDEGLTRYDSEQGILTGKILERQKDRLTSESKYRIRGEIAGGGEVEIIAKLSSGKVVIITVYVL